VAERVNPTVEDAYWREHYAGESYYEAGRSYDDYRPAFELGWSARAAREADFDAIEPSLAEEWKVRRGSSSLEWEQARPATRAAWDRTESAYFRTGNPDANTADFEEVLDNDHVVAVLNDMLETARDGEIGFQACADEVGEPNLQQVFYDRAEQWRQGADELVQLIARYGGTSAEGGTTGGAVRRGWAHVKGTMGANGDLSMLEECQRAEDAAVSRYRKALEQNLPSEVRSFLERQAQGAQRSHDQIRDLRNEARRAGDSGAPLPSANEAGKHGVSPPRRRSKRG
jgi:uncharacterized protein (TIGR02284 family)